MQCHYVLSCNICNNMFPVSELLVGHQQALRESWQIWRDHRRTSASQRSEPLGDNFTVADISVPVARTVRSLGVTLDNTPSFDDHIDDVCVAACYHIRALHYICRPVFVIEWHKGSHRGDGVISAGLLQLSTMKNVFVEPQQVATYPECLGVYCHDQK